MRKEKEKGGGKGTFPLQTVLGETKGNQQGWENSSQPRKNNNRLSEALFFQGSPKREFET